MAMNKTKETTLTASGREQKSALASPLRLEIIGLFTNPEALAISDMAQLMGRSAGSLYHHVGILEKAGLLKRSGTRPKGKRYEALFRPAASRVELDATSSGEESVQLAVKTLASAFRMAERDLESALRAGIRRLSSGESEGAAQRSGGEKIAGLEMSDLEALGHVKFDVLGINLLDKLMLVKELVGNAEINKQST